MRFATYKAPAADKPMFRMTRNLLIVDDEPHIINSLKRELFREGYEIFTAPDAASALEEIRTREIGVVLSDIQMPGMDGISMLEQIRQAHPSIVRLVLTGYGTFEHAEKAINRAQVFGFMTKPWTGEQLRETVANAFLYHGHMAEMIVLNRKLGDVNAALKEKTALLENRVSESGERLRQSMRSGYEKIAGIIDAKVAGSEGHSLRVHDLTLRLCLAAGSPY
ncbi:MAG TPA: response regulator, partial [Geobacteraceae bacterium]|nr:response regulator [Geobacteraceae bacterium]